LIEKRLDLHAILKADMSLT